MIKRAPINTEAEAAEFPERVLMDALLSGSPGEAIYAQERAGQSSFVNSDTLPQKMSDDTRQALETAGVVFGDPVPGDDLFVYVELPEGWTRRGTSHDIHSDLLDEKGRKRASIFYKAAFYDRRADMNIVSRFEIRSKYDVPDGTLVMNIYDCDTIVFTVSDTYEGEMFSDAYNKAGNKLRQACFEWFTDNGFPDWLNASLYWD